MHVIDESENSETQDSVTISAHILRMYLITLDSQITVSSRSPATHLRKSLVGAEGKLARGDAEVD